MLVRSATGAVFTISPGRWFSQADIDARLKAGDWTEVVERPSKPKPDEKKPGRTRNARTSRVAK